MAAIPEQYLDEFTGSSFTALVAAPETTSLPILLSQNLIDSTDVVTLLTSVNNSDTAEDAALSPLLQSTRDSIRACEREDKISAEPNAKAIFASEEYSVIKDIAHANLNLLLQVNMMTSLETSTETISQPNATVKALTEVVPSSAVPTETTAGVAFEREAAEPVSEPSTPVEAVIKGADEGILLTFSSIIADIFC